MNTVEELQVLQPLFASLSTGFDKFSDSVKRCLWKLGNQILDRAHKGTIFDKTTKLHAGDSESDNVDVIYETSQMVNILKPILKTGTMGPLMKILRKHCVQVFKDTIKSFQPHEIIKAKQLKQTDDSPDIEELGWLAALVTEETTPKETGEQNPTDASTRNASEKGTLCEDAPSYFVKRRLRRHESDYNGKSGHWENRNSRRKEMITKATAIFDLCIDSDSDDVTLSKILTSLSSFDDGCQRTKKARTDTQEKN